MPDLRSKLSTLSAEKRLMLEKLLQQRIKDSFASSITIPKRDKDIPTPLSFMQERLWFLHQLDPDLNAYNEFSTYAIHGCLDINALQRSFEVVITRHEILHTVYQEKDGEPVQVVLPSSPFQLELVDLSSFPQNKRLDELKGAAEKQVQKPFILSSDSVIRAVLYRLEDKEHILLCIIHHIASDGWSLALFWGEIFKIYDATLRKEVLILSDLPIQYSDFASWQRKWFDGNVMQKQLQYWRSALQGLTPAELPTDWKRSSKQNFTGAELRCKVPVAVMRKVYETSRLANVTPYMILLAVFYVLLMRLTGKKDIAVGTPVANRRFVETEPLVGFFVNTLVVRVNLDGDPSFKEILDRVRLLTLDVFDHQEMPFERLVEELHIERQLNRTPLFQAFFNFVSRRDEPFEPITLQVERINLIERSAKFDLTFYVFESVSGVDINLTYNADLFSKLHMEELLGQYLSLLVQVSEDVSLPIDALSLVTDTARQILPDPGKVLLEPELPPVTEMFLRQVEETPDAIAVELDGQKMSYAQLAVRAQQVARELLSQGLQPGQVAAVCGPRCFDMIASALGVFIIGGVLLLLDPDLPGVRQEIMLKSSQAVLILRIEQNRVDLPEVVILDNSTGVGGSSLPSAEIPFPKIEPEDRAYIFFTSGSTGAPKGIQGQHKGLSHFLNWQKRTFDIGVNDRVGQLTHLSFDVVLRDLFTILISGGTLVLPPPGGVPPHEVLTWLADNRITLLHTVSSLARYWLDTSSELVNLPNLRLTFFAGEMLSGEFVNRWRKHLASDSEVINLYGPSETTLAKAFFRAPASPESGNLPVGVPLPQTQLLVLTSSGLLCGIGEPGQVVIRTPFATLGYLPETGENNRFVSNPFGDEKPNRLFLTGDVGRYRPDGILEILGRVDEQVKVRGVLIQPQEIMNVLQSHPDIAGCFVRGFETLQGDSEIVAYLVPAANRNLEAEKVRTFISGHLPHTMIPAVLVVVEKIPLMPNGKVDRNALPEPKVGIIDESRVYIPPRTPVEQTLAQIWQEVLKVQRVGVEDNFFDLGGHSLIAMRVAARIRQIFNIEIALRELFELPTLAGLADRIGLLQKEEALARGIARDEGEIY